MKKTILFGMTIGVAFMALFALAQIIEGGQKPAPFFPYVRNATDITFEVLNYRDLKAFYCCDIEVALDDVRTECNDFQVEAAKTIDEINAIRDDDCKRKAIAKYKQPDITSIQERAEELQTDVKNTGSKEDDINK